jgi:hypothetical protein
MRFFSFLFIFLTFSLSIYAGKILHVVEWDSYLIDLENSKFHSAYTTFIYPENKLTDPILSVTDISWEQITDTVIISVLKAAKIREITPSINLFSASGKQVIEISIDPIKQENDSFFRIKSFNIEIEKNNFPTSKSGRIFSSQSVLASGNWIKLSTVKSGIHKITYSRLIELGITNPANLAIYSNGGYMLPKMNNIDYPDDLTQLPVFHTKDKNGQDCVFFYSTGSTEWKYNPVNGLFEHNINLYSDSTYFYISSDVTKSPELPVSEKINSVPDTILYTYTACDFYEKENINLIKSGRRWFSDRITNLSPKSYPPFDFPNAVTGSEAIVTIASAARCSTPSYYTLHINDSFTSSIQFNSVDIYYEYSKFADTNESNFKVPAKTTMNITLNYNGENGDSWLDYINLNVKSHLNFNGNQLLFKSPESLTHKTLEYHISTNNMNGVLWNITSPLHPKQILTTGESDGISFIDAGLSINEYILFDPINGVFTEPIYTGKIKNQNIHGLPSYEMIIVTHPDFQIQSERLAEYHRQNDNMSVLVLTTPEIYNEFSSGLPDVSAIRNMLRIFYSRNDNSLNQLRYVLLMGDGSYNNRKFDGSKNNFIPTYQSEDETINKGDSYVMDDYFGLLDENEGESIGMLDIGIGRIPVITTSEAENVVDKIISYSQSFGEWRNVVCFIADDFDLTDGSGFMEDSEILIDTLNRNYAGFNIKKIYLDSYQQITTSGGPRYPDVTVAINQSVNEGALILNYIGHANTQSLSHENVLGINDIKSWNNSKALPLFITATCEFGRFDDDEISAGEEILLNPIGGGIGLFTTTRPVYSSNNLALSKKFYSNIFKLDEKGEKLRLGDVMKNAKNLLHDDTNKFNFSLLTDPALRLAFPKYNVRTKSINNVDVQNDVANIGALDKVTIKGEVVDANGTILTNYNGDITTIVYDKVVNVVTLNNDNNTNGGYTYPVQNNIIYRGVSSVINGEFELSFIVPKDISYNVGKGRIIYYTSNVQDDGNGSTIQFNIGGSSSNPVIDNNAPEMNLFINNENFKSYDKVSSNSLLLVNLFDESGINTVGTGIGHDLVAVLDSNYSDQIVLNNYYSSEPNSYQHGKIIYPLNNLSPGIHKIWVKIWDVQNNSSEKEIYFIVGDGFRVTNAQNIPNPVRSFTDFEITHNLPGEVFDVSIDIYNLNGKKINQIKESVSSTKTTKIKVRWNIFQSEYPVFSNQILVYRVTLTNQEGLNAYGVGKILINMQN